MLFEWIHQAYLKSIRISQHLAICIIAVVYVHAYNYDCILYEYQHSPCDRIKSKMTPILCSPQKAYFNKQEEALLRKLLKKMKVQADAEQSDEVATALKKERDELSAIVDKYNVSEEDKAKLIEWRHSEHH